MSFSRTCERRIRVAVLDDSGKSASSCMCGQPADCWAKHVFVDCDEDPGVTYYEALCVNHALDGHAGYDVVLSAEEMELIEVHES